MNFEPLIIGGSFRIQPETFSDNRGFFARTYCSRTFAEHGMNTNVRQCSISFNTKKHTLRGMHYQLPPHQEAKLVRCTQGAAHHIILDLREDSASFMKWTGIELNCDNRHSLYVPEGVAHGFITLAAATEVLYQMSVDYVPELAAGVRWNDPAFDINWPVKPVIVSDRDSSYADFDMGPN